MGWSCANTGNGRRDKKDVRISRDGCEQIAVAYPLVVFWFKPRFGEEVSQRNICGTSGQSDNLT